MNALEWRATLSLGAMYALRLVGVFMILPIFEIYARNLPQHPGPFMVGFALTASGLTQALFQIPLGRLSDRIGRKPVIALGMLIFACGSLVAGLSDRIEIIALGRALQGVGAVSSAVTALLADVTRETVRTTAMAIMGAGMGFAFVVALVVGPLAEGVLGVPGIFLMAAGLSLLTLPVIWWAAPTPERVSSRAPLDFRKVLADPQLLNLAGGILMLHATLICLFTGVPLLIQTDLGWAPELHWKLYLPILLLSLVAALPLMRRADRSGARGLLVGAVALLALSLLVVGLVPGTAGLVAGLLLFFLPFNLLEGLLPSLVSRQAPAEHKGAALGVYATAQFLGQPVGGVLGGWAMTHYGAAGVLTAGAALPLLWLGFALRLRPPPLRPPA